ncbi:MAG: DUF6155 family protein [Saprospiraceae bacterium]
MKKDLNKYLDSLSEKELTQEIIKLYDKFEPVRQYYTMELSDDSEKVLADFKAQLKKEYFPNRGFGRAGSKASRKIVSDFKKIAVHKKDVVELLLYRTEIMIDFTAAYGDMDEAFYNSLGSGFAEACKLIRQEQLESYFRAYCQELIGKCYDFGWGCMMI